MKVSLKIKPLAWHRYDCSWIANSPFEAGIYTYKVYVDSVGQIWTDTRLHGLPCYFPSVESAKEACQQHYEALIVSAFDDGASA